MKNIFRAVTTLAVLAVLYGCVPVRTQHPHAALFEKVDSKLRPGIVRVRIQPEADADGRRSETFYDVQCPNCKTRHMIPLDMLIDRQKPLELPGFVMANGDILMADPGLNSDRKITVEAMSFSGEVTPVEIAEYIPMQKAVVLRTADGKIPAGAEPLIFKEPLPETPLFDYYYVSEDGVWVSGIAPHSTGRYSQIPAGNITTYDFTSPQTVVTDPAGNPVTVIMNSESNSAAGVFEERPESWQRIPAGEMAALEKEFRDSIANRVYPVHFKFRPVDLRQERINGNTDQSLEQNHEDAKGILMPDGTVMVTTQQSPDMTARLSSVTIDTPAGSVEGEFVRALEDYNVIFIRPAEALSTAEAGIFTGNIVTVYNNPVWLAGLKNYGEENDISVRRGHVDGINAGYKNIPNIQIFSEENVDYIFSGNGELLAARADVRVPGRNGRFPAGNTESAFVAAATLVMAPDSRVIAPKTPEERLKFDWIGVETRTLDEALAAAYSVARFTDNGQRGLIISKVYPGTPAAEAGLQKGDIILSLKDPSGRVFRMDGAAFEVPDWEGNFIWDEYDSIPEINYDQIPTPWVNQRTPLNMLISQLGPEAEITLNYARNGELCTVELQAVAAPLFFENAPRIVMNDIGLTVVDPTVEVRDYFRLADDTPGVLIARVRSGSKASVAGLMPYEIITAVNDKPVTDAGSFAAELAELSKGKREVMLTVRRLGVSRLVTMRIDK